MSLRFLSFFPLFRAFFAEKFLLKKIFPTKSSLSLPIRWIFSGFRSFSSVFASSTEIPDHFSKVFAFFKAL